VVEKKSRQKGGQRPRGAISPEVKKKFSLEHHEMPGESPQAKKKESGGGTA